MDSPDAKRTLLNYIGIGVLLVGMATGEFIYWRSTQSGMESSADADALVLLADSKAHDYEMEKNIGAFGMVLYDAANAVKRLGEPGPMGIAIGVVSAIVAGGCFWVAWRMPRGV